jgi:hypothetical protein
LALYEITKKLESFPSNSSEEDKRKEIKTIYTELTESFKSKLTEFISNFK